MHRLLSRWLLRSVAALALTAAVGIYWEARRAKNQAYPAAARRDGKPIPVRTVAVAARTIDNVIGATAVTTPSNTAVIQIGSDRDLNIGSPVSDIRIKSVRVQEGDRVAAGQVLFELDDTLLQQLARQRSAAVEAARATLERAKKMIIFGDKARAIEVTSSQEHLRFRNEDLDIRKHQYTALEQLAAIKLVRDFDFYESKSKFAQARFELRQAEHRLDRARDSAESGRIQDELEVTRAQSLLQTAEYDAALAARNLEQCKITTPLSGIVDRFELVPGQIVAPNSTLLQVLKLDPILVRVDFPQERLDEVAVGQEAEVALDAFPGEAFRGKVLRIAPAVNAQLRILPIVVALENPNGRIRPGITGFARIRSTRSGLSIPSLAVQQHNGKACVFCVKGGRAKLREVTLGPVVETGQVEVRHGLAADDEVVVFHNFYRHTDDLAVNNAYLQDDDLVDVDWRRWARRDTRGDME